MFLAAVKQEQLFKLIVHHKYDDVGGGSIRWLRRQENVALNSVTVCLMTSTMMLASARLLFFDNDRLLLEVIQN